MPQSGSDAQARGMAAMSTLGESPARAHGGGIRCAIGLMSGTSMDGIDVALIESDGLGHVEFGPTRYEPYDAEERRILRRAVAEAAALTDRRQRLPALAAAEQIVTDRHALAIERFTAENALEPGSVAVVGFHGQTVLHRPKQGLTVQLGDGEKLARRIGIPTVFDLRAADVAAGGEGAPLVPAYHRALVQRAAMTGPVAVLNVGGVANLTLVPGGDHDPIACDTGPGNALIDDLMLARIGEPIDRDGAAAARGGVDERTLEALLAHPYFELPPPKSLDRNHFSISPVESLATEDAAATLTAFTAAAVARTFDHLATAPGKVIVCGGGARNPRLMHELATRLTCPVVTADTVGWSAEAMEAQAFAYLALRTLHGLPLTFPTTTGVPRAMTGGILAEP